MSVLGGRVKPQEVSGAPEAVAVLTAAPILTDDAPVTVERVTPTSVPAVGRSDSRVQHAPAPVPTSAVSVGTPRRSAIAVSVGTPRSGAIAVSVGTSRSGAIIVKSRRLYVSVATKFTLAMAFTVAWVWLSVWVSSAWVRDLEPVAGTVLAWAMVILVAYLPGAIVAFLAVSLMLDRQPPLRVASPTTALTVIIAARNEERGIGETIAAISRTDYAGPVAVILADNGSTDGTCDTARRTAADLGVSLRIISELTPGKSNALNTALGHVETPYVVTVDADTLLHLESLRRLVSRLESAPPDIAEVAGTVLVRNSRVNLLARMQEWDYYLGIAAVKRMQGLYQAALVAQGAFSLSLTAETRRVGGWPGAIGEDIVMTWRLLENGDRVLFEPTAVAFTDAPVQSSALHAAAGAVVSRLRVGAWDARGYWHGGAVAPFTATGRFHRRHRPAHPFAGSGLRADLAARIGPVLPWVPADCLSVDACRPAGHALGIRRVAHLPGPARLRPGGPAGARQPAGLRRLPARVPGSVLDSGRRRVHAAPRGGASALEVSRVPSDMSEVEDGAAVGGGCRLCGGCRLVVVVVCPHRLEQRQVQPMRVGAKDPSGEKAQGYIGRIDTGRSWSWAPGLRRRQTTAGSRRQP
ncbi:MAG: glycosyltransferase family 2 protein [Dermatophilaceae bacterium]